MPFPLWPPNGRMAPPAKKSSGSIVAARRCRPACQSPPDVCRLRDAQLAFGDCSGGDIESQRIRVVTDRHRPGERIRAEHALSAAKWRDAGSGVRHSDPDHARPRDVLHVWRYPPDVIAAPDDNAAETAFSGERYSCFGRELHGRLSPTQRSVDDRRCAIAFENGARAGNDVATLSETRSSPAVAKHRGNRDRPGWHRPASPRRRARCPGCPNCLEDRGGEGPKLRVIYGGHRGNPAPIVRNVLVSDVLPHRIQFHARCQFRYIVTAYECLKALTLERLNRLSRRA